MHPYTPFLIDDIKKAHCKDTFEKEVKLSFEEEMEAIERWCEGEDATYSFGYYCSLQPEIFPPAEQLDNDDIVEINKAFLEMMNTWNIDIALPDEMPPKIRYPYLVNCLIEKVDIVSSGFYTIDFCTGYAPGCELREYCSCLEFWNDLPEEPMDSPAGDLPF